MFIRTGFKELIPIVEGGREIRYICVDRDARTGYTGMAYISTPRSEQAELNTHHWDIASSKPWSPLA
jgi:hypothetical protein